MRRTLILTCTILLIFTGCAAKRLDDLQRRSKNYNRSLRWSSVSTAATYFHPDHKMKLLQQIGDRFHNERIVDFNVIDASMQPEGSDDAAVIVQFTYYMVEDQNLRRRQELQNWSYNPIVKNWYLIKTKALNSTKPGEGPVFER